MNELLNEILRKVSQLSPSELSILLEAGHGLQVKAAASGICIDTDTHMGFDEKKTDDLMVTDEI